MKKQRFDVRVNETALVTVELLAPRIARVVDAWTTLTVTEGDIIRLSHDPSDDAAPPQMTEILFKNNPIISEIEFWTFANRNRMIALAAVLGAEVLGFDDFDHVPDGSPCRIRVAHSESLDVEAIALAAGISDDPDADLFDDEADDEADDDEEQAGGAAVPNFDELMQKPVDVPLFVWDDGETRPFQGLCRGNDPSGDEEDWEDCIGVCTAEGKSFCVVIDMRVHCAVPQFFIDRKPFYFPIVRFETGREPVDPTTGTLKPPPNPDQSHTGLPGPSSAVPDSAEPGNVDDKVTSPDDRQ